MASTRAGRRQHRITDALIERLEGELQTLRDRNVKFLPAVALPQRYISGLIGVPIRVISRWLREAAQPRAAEELVAFADVHRNITAIFAGRYESNLLAIANDPTNRHALAANLKLAEKTGDELWTENAEPVDDDTGVPGVDASLLALMTDEELAALEEREAVEVEMAKQIKQQNEKLVADLRARAAAQRASGESP